MAASIRASPWGVDPPPLAKAKAATNPPPRMAKQPKAALWTLPAAPDREGGRR